MTKKASILLLLAAAVFASPVSAGYDNPIPMCYPCDGR